jgi:DNA-binding NarL/FixJ family response regulator
MRYELSPQPLVLVIDPDASARALVRHAVQSQSGALVLEAHDALSGIDLATEHDTDLQLVVLDVRQPDLDGYDLCLRLRDIGAQQQSRIAILPFTEPGVQELLLAELGCAPPCYKPASVEQLAAAVGQALAVCPPLPPTSQLLVHARQRAAVAEQLARRERIGRLALLASALPARLSLQYLLASTGAHIVAEAPTAPLLEQLLERRRIQLLVADAGDRHAAVDLAMRLCIPLLLVATAVDHRQALATDVPLLNQAQGIVDATDEQAPLVLAAAVTTLISGERFVHLPLDQLAPSTDQLVPDMIDRLLSNAGLTGRERAVLWLDNQGWSNAQIAGRLGVTAASVVSYWKRMQRKIGANRNGIRAWVSAQTRGSAGGRGLIEHEVGKA